jgi:TonB-linked SusC/RagA family outer membrane protein
MLFAVLLTKIKSIVMDISTPRSNLVVRFLTVFLLCCTSLYASADQTGKQKITVVASDVTLETVFKQIEKQTGLRFMYAVDAVDVKEKVTVAFEKVMLDEVLGMLLGKKGIEWVYREGVISLKLHQTKSFVLELADPPINVSGKILDAKGTPIPGATVMIKGGRKGTKTDGDGIFTLSGVSLNSILLITHIGFESKEVVANKNIITIHMNEIAGILDETVIVGYGTTTQRFNTGNVTSIKGDDITKNPVSNVLVALQGKVPGMNITQTTGLPGGQIKVQIRGQNSIKNGTVPLFIVDGVPYEPSVTTTTFGNYGALGDVISALNFINPSDIESIDVLKDADATAIYGSRGANGVVLITTKKGSTSETRVEVNVNQGWQSLAHKQKLLTTKEYLQVRREAFSNDNEVPTIENAPDLLLWDTTRYTNWQDVLIGGTASYTDAQASVSGGSNVVSFMMGGNFHRETTVFPGDFNSQRGGGHFSIMSTTPNQRLRASIIGNYTINKNSYPGQDFASKISLPPNAPPIYNSDGSLNWANSTWENPFSQLVSEKSESETNNFVVNVLLNYRFTDALMFKMNIGYNEVRNNTFSASLIEGRPPQDINTARAFATYLNSKLTAWISEPQITYNKDFGKGAINTMIGATLLSNSIDGNYLFTADILQDALVRFPASAGSYRIFGNGSKYKYVGLFG